MASIYPRGNKLYLRYKHNGKDKREALDLFDNPDGWGKAEIIKKEKEIELLKNRQEHSSGKIKLLAAFDIFMERKKKEATVYENYYFAKTALYEFLNRKDVYVSVLKEDDLLDFTNWLKKNKSHNTAATYLNHLRTFFAFLIKRGYIEYNPVRKLRPIKMPIITITRDDRDKIFSYFLKKDIHFAKYLNLLYLSGFRRGEALSLSNDNLIWERKLIQVYNSKDKRWDEFPMIRNLDLFFKQFINYKERFFPYSGNNISKYFTSNIKKLDLSANYSLHDFRRTFGMEMSVEVPPLKLKQLMRHRDIRTTLKYYVDENKI